MSLTVELVRFETVYRVTGGAEPQTVIVTKNMTVTPPLLTVLCSCPDFRYRPERRPCKHVREVGGHMVDAGVITPTSGSGDVVGLLRPERAAGRLDPTPPPPESPA